MDDDNGKFIAICIVAVFLCLGAYCLGGHHKQDEMERELVSKGYGTYIVDYQHHTKFVWKETK